MGVFRKSLFGDDQKLNPLNIILSLVFIIALWYFCRWIYRKYKSLNSLSSLADARVAKAIKANELANSNTNDFTISVWFIVNDWNYRFNEKKILLARGSNGTEISFDSNVNDINIKLNTYKGTSGTSSNGLDQMMLSEEETTVETGSSTTNSSLEGSSVDSTSESTGSDKQHTCTIKNFPLQKWVNLIISVNGRSLDVYIDGKLVRTCVLPGIAKIDKVHDIVLTPNGGFHGFTSNMIYIPDSSNPEEAYNIYKRGYGNAWYNSLFNKYRLKVSLLKDNVESNSINF